jgi:UDP-N-acetylglucosamine acyltransferase
MSRQQIHPTAIVAPEARLAEGVIIGPYAVIADQVEIGANTVIGPHVVIHRFVRLGERNHVHAHAMLGDLPQDTTFSGLETWVEVGNDNVIREGATIHRATAPEHPTLIGSNCLLMAYAHVAHDCRVGNGATLTNNVGLGGHVEVGDRAVLGAGVLIHQFARIGCYAMVGGAVRVRKDVLPYSLVAGIPARHYRLNTIGLRRAGISGQRYRVLEAAFRALRIGMNLDELPETPELAYLRAWLSAPSKRGLTGFLSEGRANLDLD